MHAATLREFLADTSGRVLLLIGLWVLLGIVVPPRHSGPRRLALADGLFRTFTPSRLSSAPTRDEQPRENGEDHEPTEVYRAAPGELPSLRRHPREQRVRSFGQLQDEICRRVPGGKPRLKSPDGRQAMDQKQP